MQQVYLKRMTKQDITKSVTVCFESVERFWGVSKNATKEYAPIMIASEDNSSYFPKDITIHKGYQGEKDWRITGAEFKSLYSHYDPQEKDIMCVKKIKSYFLISIIKQGTSEYKILSSFFIGSDNYVILDVEKKSNASLQILAECTYSSYLTAMRTKPFLLLAGISGTGKSRIVKKMAFESCPNKDALRSDPTSPGNYKLIEVKPNWHDSSEVLGYESQIGGAHYVVTPFIQFLVKAMKYQDVPFFVCMDEMNLAPVEQYFAEFLSVLESRTLEDNEITSEALIPATIFRKYESTLSKEIFGRKVEKNNNYVGSTADVPAEYSSEKENDIYETLKEKGLRIPNNLIVIGTVNMDETTHQFSRKVIDRAMTIEMNIEDSENSEKNPFNQFFESDAKLGYLDEPISIEDFKPNVVLASDALQKMEKEGVDIKEIKKKIPALLSSLNKALDGTPFKVAYRVQNELVVYLYQLYQEDNNKSVDDLLKVAMDDILMFKVLPRIEGDEDMLETPLKELATFVSPYPNSKKKVEEMQERLSRTHFTSFWP